MSRLVCITREKKEPDGVPASEYWFTDGTETIGFCVLRHFLNERLERNGGHIWFTIHPERRGEGHGGALLSLALAEARKCGIKHALLTCPAGDIASVRIIKKNGGVFIDSMAASVLRAVADTGLGIEWYRDERFRIRAKRVIRGGDMYLRLTNFFPEEKYCPTYRYRIYLRGIDEQAGYIDLRVGMDEEIYYSGNIGYFVEPEFRGAHLAARACRLVRPLAKAHGLRRISITCNPDNIASAKTIESLGAKYLEHIKIPPDNELYEMGDRYKRRYLWDT